MRLFREDKKLSNSTAYMRPDFAFGRYLAEALWSVVYRRKIADLVSDP
jgi:hypothetical protein